MEGIYDRCIAFIIKEMKEFIAFLESLLGRKMDWDKLDETIRLTEEICRVWHEINELRKAESCPMHSRDFWSSMAPGLYLIGDLEDTLKRYRDMYNEVKYRVDSA